MSSTTVPGIFGELDAVTQPRGEDADSFMISRVSGRMIPARRPLV